MQCLLLGGTGQVGRALQACWRTTPGSWDVDAPPSAQLSLQDPEAVAAHVRRTRPALVVNGAAYTRVDDAESHPDVARVVNAEAPGMLARAAAAVGARLVHLSTDYVFDGRGGAPYRPDAPTTPQGVYARTKRDGERAVLEACPGALVVRTAWVHSATPPNFVATAVRVLMQGAVMRVVDDQVGTPTRAAQLAEVVDALLAAMEGDPTVAGIMHATDAGVASWYDVACAVLERLGELGLAPATAGVVPVTTAEFPRPAPRPAVAVLDCHATWARLGRTPPHWRVGVRATVDELVGEGAVKV
ncbi:MAG: dTDP-4-dehydrorhamnose reductase [Gemmatimonadetes bacterium]|nr:dTDP-4-dehydrorhamnose reductase [Gemmatimonadota bacterium]